MWGEAVDGVRFAIEFKDSNFYKVGDHVTLVIKAQNTTDKPVTFEQVAITGIASTAKGQLDSAVPKVTDAKERPVKATALALPGEVPTAKVAKIQLAAKETVTLGQVTYSIGPALNMPVIDASPGVYYIHFDTVCWLPGHQRPTGKLGMQVLPKER